MIQNPGDVLYSGLGRIVPVQRYVLAFAQQRLADREFPPDVYRSSARRMVERMSELLGQLPARDVEVSQHPEVAKVSEGLIECLCTKQGRAKTLHRAEQAGADILLADQPLFQFGDACL